VRLDPIGHGLGRHFAIDPSAPLRLTLSRVSRMIDPQPGKEHMVEIVEKDGRTLIRVRVQPKASRNTVVLGTDGRIRVCLTAPPVRGEANRALMAFLAKALGIPKGALTLVSGENARDKTIRVSGRSASELLSRLQGFVEGSSPRHTRDALR
jgi:uncharacterized protein (TIGR00251 family)